MRTLSVHTAFFVTALSLILLFSTPVGAQLIPAVNRVDMALDHLRGILYISNGGELVRYRLSDQTLLAPLTVGTALRGVDISPDGATLAVAENATAGADNFVHLVDLETLAINTVAFTRDTGEAGTYSVAWGNDGRLLISSDYSGSGEVPLRRYDPATGNVVTLASIGQRSMLAANADRSIIAFEESNNSAGPFGRYRVSDGDLLDGPGTGWFNYEVGVNRTGTQFAFPTFDGCYIYDGALASVTKLGANATNHPIGVVYHPAQDLLFAAWSGTDEVRAFDTATFTPMGAYSTGTAFNHPGNFGYVEGRLKISAGGGKLFVTADGGVQLINLGNSPPVARADSGATTADQPLSVLSAIPGISVLENDVDFDPATTLTVVGFDAASAQGAAVAVNGDGSFSYDPTGSPALQALASGSTVVDTFTYTVSDGAATQTGTVSITVTGSAVALPAAGPAGLALLALFLGWSAWRRTTRRVRLS